MCIFLHVHVLLYSCLYCNAGNVAEVKCETVSITTPQSPEWWQRQDTGWWVCSVVWCTKMFRQRMENINIVFANIKGNEKASCQTYKQKHPRTHRKRNKKAKTKWKRNICIWIEILYELIHNSVLRILISPSLTLKTKVFPFSSLFVLYPYIHLYLYNIRLLLLHFP